MMIIVISDASKWFLFMTGKVNTSKRSGEMNEK
jgi:hypothetical protein